jgi:hypothetical protein
LGSQITIEKMMGLGMKPTKASANIAPPKGGSSKIHNK